MLEIAPLFPRVPGYLDTATYGLPAHATTRALHEATDAWAVGALDPVALDAAVDRMRAAYASLVGAEAADVTLAGSTSQVVGMVAASLPDGARVLVARCDFASVRMPFEADPRLRVIEVPLARLVDEVRPGVDLVAVSAVQSADGTVVDLGALALAARVAGARTLVDASHAAGWMDIRAREFDVVVASAYKWLGAPRGIALAAVHPAATWIRPVVASWYGADVPWDALYGSAADLSAGARRLDTSPAWQTAEAGAVALEILAAQGAPAIREHAVGLANLFRAEAGLAPGASPIVAVDLPRADALAAAGIRAATRNGRARLAFWVHSTEDDALNAARAIRAGVPAGV
ncbi:aminotransferase class V-fold PLP-dependent enzyme [Demequina lignilytica]|uniref:Aminotransferase class V-fold PLP-dependent enzyme n=1 Tax=Demequina lignilytica TaxID=3051663 RepID=A0AB35MKH0_9MICO|nr:aminotransferase class V-fold PLP-dependent enzyme [Demequina sp. SYSU T0a273]MDN4484258.1 aminotransferase class V-fold PLP-dependent enzyme [Demequina sp. SYSU T0a273]